MRIIDFAARPIPAQEIRAAGYDGIVGYVAEARPGTNFLAKPLTREYADSLRAAGLHIVSNFQYGKPGGSAPSDFTRGFDGGVEDARSALRLHAAAGGPDTAPIIFSIDEDIDLDTWNDVGVEWFRGINSVLGVGRTGIYGHSRVCAWAIQDRVVGYSSTPGRQWAWQTKAWSYGGTEPAAVLFQDVVDTASNPGPLVDGVRVDSNAVLAEDFGQWDYDRVIPVRPDFDESTEIRSPYRGSRDGVEVLWFVLHTQDGPGEGGSARNLAQYLSDNPKSVSYHYTVDNDGHVYDVVDTKYYANSVFEPGNSKSVNLAFAGSKAGWSRETWLNRMQRGIDVAAYIAVRDARRYGLQVRVISPEEARRGESGITDHNGVRIATGVGTHTDVGAGFPWDYFNQKVAEYAGTATRERGRTHTAHAYPGASTARGATGPEVADIQARLNAAAAAGLLVDGDFGNVTSDAVAAFQAQRGLISDGEIGATTWDELFSGKGHVAPPTNGWPVARVSAVAPRDVTGPGVTSSVHMEGADLGIMRWDPDRQAIAAMFGDNFEFPRFGGVAQSPSIVMYDTNYNVRGIPGPNRSIQPNTFRRQLWPYQRNNHEYSTILPCDFIRIGDWWHVAVMVTAGLGNELRTEFHRSRDLLTWEVQPELTLRHPSHPGNVMLTFDQIGDYVYIFGTGGLHRDRGIWMWRNPVRDFPRGWWEPWGWDGFRWDWGIPNEETPILGGQFGELCFRNIQGNCVLSYFDRLNYRQQARTVEAPEHNWLDGANIVDYAFGWQIPQLYGGYISPLSRLNEENGMHFWVSQWNTDTNDPYRVMNVQDTLFARGPLREVAPREARRRGAPSARDIDLFARRRAIPAGPEPAIPIGAVRGVQNIGGATDPAEIDSAMVTALQDQVGQLSRRFDQMFQQIEQAHTEVRSCLAAMESRHSEHLRELHRQADPEPARTGVPAMPIGYATDPEPMNESSRQR